MCLIAQCLHQLFVVSASTHLVCMPVALEYSSWYCFASHSAQVFHPTKNVVAPVACGVALSKWNSKYPCSLSVREFTHLFLWSIESPSGHFTILNPGIHREIISSMIFLVTSASDNPFQYAPLSWTPLVPFAKLWPIAKQILNKGFETWEAVNFFLASCASDRVIPFEV